MAEGLRADVPVGVHVAAGELEGGADRLRHLVVAGDGVGRAPPLRQRRRARLTALSSGGVDTRKPAGGDEVDERGRHIRGDSLLILLNAHHEAVHFTLPSFESAAWERVFDTADILRNRKPALRLGTVERPVVTGPTKVDERVTARLQLIVDAARQSTALERAGMEMTLISRKQEGWGARRFLRADPFHLGNLWRDWSFARAARKAWQREHFDVVQSHERIPGCDVYRAGDGVHRRWLDLRRASAGAAEKLGIALNP